MTFENLLQIDTNMLNKKAETSNILLDENIETEFKDIFNELKSELDNIIENSENEKLTDDCMSLVYNVNSSLFGQQGDIQENGTEDIEDEKLNIEQQFDKNIKIGTKKINSVKCYLNSSEGSDFSVDSLDAEGIYLKSDSSESNTDLEFLNFTTNVNEISPDTSQNNQEKKSASEHQLDKFLLGQDFSTIDNETYTTKDTNLINQEHITTEKEILKQIKEGLNSNSTSRSIQVMLKPSTLGKVNINLKFFNNTLHINLFVENSLTEEVLKQNITQVLEMIDPSSLIKVEKVNIKKFSDLYNDYGTDEELEVKSEDRRSLIKKPQYIKGIYRL